MNNLLLILAIEFLGAIVFSLVAYFLISLWGYHD